MVNTNGSNEGGAKRSSAGLDRLRLPFASADDLVNLIQKVNLLEKRKLWFIFDWFKVAFLRRVWEYIKNKGNILFEGFSSFRGRERRVTYIDESQHKLHHGRINGHSATRQLVVNHHVPWLLHMCNESCLHLHLRVFSESRLVWCTCLLVKASGLGW